MLDFVNHFLGFISNVFDFLMNFQFDGIFIFAALAGFGIVVFAFEELVEIITGG